MREVWRERASEGGMERWINRRRANKTLELEKAQLLQLCTTMQHDLALMSERGASVYPKEGATQTGPWAHSVCVRRSLGSGLNL